MQELEGKHDEEPHTKELDQATEDPFVDPKNVGSPFILQIQQKSSAGGAHKKRKYDKNAGAEAMVLTEGDLDEIGDTVRTTK